MADNENNETTGAEAAEEEPQAETAEGKDTNPTPEEIPEETTDNAEDNNNGNDSDDCRLHPGRHTNAECYQQHPEIAHDGWLVRNYHRHQNVREYVDANRPDIARQQERQQRPPRQPQGNQPQGGNGGGNNQPPRQQPQQGGIGIDVIMSLVDQLNRIESAIVTLGSTRNTSPEDELLMGVRMITKSSTAGDELAKDRVKTYLEAHRAGLDLSDAYLERIIQQATDRGDELDQRLGDIIASHERTLSDDTAANERTLHDFAERQEREFTRLIDEAMQARNELETARLEKARFEGEKNTIEARKDGEIARKDDLLAHANALHGEQVNNLIALHTEQMGRQADVHQLEIAARDTMVTQHDTDRQTAVTGQTNAQQTASQATRSRGTWIAAALGAILVLALLIAVLTTKAVVEPLGTTTNPPVVTVATPPASPLIQCTVQAQLCAIDPTDPSCAMTCQP